MYLNAPVVTSWVVFSKQSKGASSGRLASGLPRVRSRFAPQAPGTMQPINSNQEVSWRTENGFPNHC